MRALPPPSRARARRCSSLSTMSFMGPLRETPKSASSIARFACAGSGNSESKGNVPSRLPRRAPHRSLSRLRGRDREGVRSALTFALRPLPIPPPHQGVHARLRRAMREREHPAALAFAPSAPALAALFAFAPCISSPYKTTALHRAPLPSSLLEKKAELHRPLFALLGRGGSPVFRSFAFPPNARGGAPRNACPGFRQGGPGVTG